ncbi:SIR2 family protein [Roseibium sp. Sym1]|uniref:SIR2 family protein n=1 Tax=Roseibium sp. Sym1 TaxID=3016006 RepID=UPI0022B315D9|nr:SIR2 family protein [Roseibium sp. Sym1]
MMSSDPTNRHKDNLKNITEELRYWPYTIHQIDDTLDSTLIEGRAKQLLFQALNSRSLTAFIGSGISAAYGRMDWNTWKDAQLEYVRDLSKSFLEVANFSIKHIDELTEIDTELTDCENTKTAVRLSQRWLRHRRQIITRARWDIENLKRTFDAANSKNGNFPGGEDLPILFEIGKKLHDLLVRHRHLFEGEDDFLGNSKKTRHRKPKLFFGTRVCASEGAPLAELAQCFDFAIAQKKIDAKLKKTFIEFRNALAAYSSKASRPEAGYDFDQLAKNLLVDECAHAESLLLSGFECDQGSGRHSVAKQTDVRTEKLRKTVSYTNENNLKRDIDGIRENKNRYKVLTPFKIERLLNLIHRTESRVPENWKKLLKTVETNLDEEKDSSAPLETRRVFLTPTSRFLVPVIYKLLERPFDSFDEEQDLHPPGSSDFTSRRSIMARRFDPLEKVSERLRISRYLTTNYDFEIERLFQDKGYRRFDPHKASVDNVDDPASDPKSFRTDGLGGVMHDMTFKSSTATDLVAFSAGGTGADVSVFHLHGRATETDDIVATERDYMDLYLRNDPDRAVVDESILMAFAATPILFLGLGMEESDVLRPLRQFMSDQDRSVGYRSIVLLPGSKDFESRAKMAAGLYLRYGAHTIFYGGGEIDVPAEGGEKRSTPQSIDWLHRMSLLISTLSEAADERLELFKKDVGELNESEIADRAKAIIDLKTLREKVGKLGNDLLLHEQKEKDTYALPILLGRTQEDFRDENLGKIELNELTLRSCSYTSYRHQNIEQSSAHRRIDIDGEKYTGFYVELLTHLMRLALGEKIRDGDLERMRRSLNALKTALNGVKGALLTANLNAALDGLEQEWHAWWQDWQARPPEREPRFEKLPAPAALPKFDKRQIPADPLVAEEEQRAAFVLPRRVVRHRVESVITDLRKCGGLTAPEPDIAHDEQAAFSKKFLTGVRVFDKFIYDIAVFSRSPAVARGRLVHTVAAERGQGKGIFFSTLSTLLGLSSYIQAAHNPSFWGKGQAKSKPPCFTSCIYINLSFATEIASVFDMLVRELKIAVAHLEIAICDKYRFTVSSNPARQFEDFLNGRLEVSPKCPDFQDAVTEHIRKKIEPRIDKLQRTEKFRNLMRRYKLAADKFAQRNKFGLEVRPRLLFCINAVELLFDDLKRPKNLEILDYLEFFSSKEAAVMPFDLIAIGALDQMGAFWKDDERLERISCVPDRLAEDERALAWKKASDRKIQYCENRPSNLLNAVNHVHFARDIDPLQFLVDNFPILALALLVSRKSRSQRNQVLSDDLNDTIRHAYETLWKTRDRLWKGDMPPDVSEAYLKSRQEFHVAVAEAFRAKAGDLWAMSISETIDTENYHNFQGELSEIAKPEGDSEDDRDWTDLKQLLAGNRFCLTILLAAAEHLIFLSQKFVDGGTAADRLLKNVVTDLRNTSVSQRENVVLQAVMSVYRRTSIIGDPDNDRELHMLLLRNVSVLGCPVSPNVLVRLPDIRDYFNKVQFDGRLSRRRMVARALAALSERGLIFRLSPHPKLLWLDRESRLPEIGVPPAIYDWLSKLKEEIPQPEMLNFPSDWYGRVSARSQAPMPSEVRAWLVINDFVNKANTPDEVCDWLEEVEALPVPEMPDEVREKLRKSFDEWPAERECRYALHRQIQGYCFERLGHLTAPPISANSFSPTLFASMPSRVVRLSAEGYLFLRRLLLGLSQYPDIRHEDAARAMPIFNDDDVVTRVQALRAGLSLARTCFSIAAVSRFDDESTGIDFIRKRGYFETYRVRLRWILRKAWEVHEPRSDNDNDIEAETYGTGPDKYRVNALYLDEIVWLYNEVAVTCLVQGALIEAIGHQRQAIFLNRQIEGLADSGRMHNMLSLNLAIIQIERGRLKSAEKRLRTILDSEPEPFKRVGWLAKGYLAVLEQLQGRRKEARQTLKEVVGFLEKDNEDRALAIMIEHLALIVAHDDAKEARKHLLRARDYAEKGGHEDVRHRILVSEVWVSQTYEDEPWKQMLSDRVKLREAQHYADMMGLYSLKVDTLHAQGMMLLAAGDFSSSGRLMTKAMAIARRNDMTLRLNTIMTDYAHVLLARRRVASAKRLLMSALTMAKRNGHSVEVVRIRDVQDEAERQSVED